MLSGVWQSGSGPQVKGFSSTHFLSGDTYTKIPSHTRYWKAFSTKIVARFVPPVFHYDCQWCLNVSREEYTDFFFLMCRVVHYTFLPFQGFPTFKVNFVFYVLILTELQDGKQALLSAPVHHSNIVNSPVWYYTRNELDVLDKDRLGLNGSVSVNLFADTRSINHEICWKCKHQFVCQSRIKTFVVLSPKDNVLAVIFPAHQRMT